MVAPIERAEPEQYHEVHAGESSAIRGRSVAGGRIGLQLEGIAEGRRLSTHVDDHHVDEQHVDHHVDHRVEHPLHGRTDRAWPRPGHRRSRRGTATPPPSAGPSTTASDSHLDRVVPYLDELGRPGTFYPTCSLVLSDAERWRAASERHEIANHTMTHAVAGPDTDPAEITTCHEVLLETIGVESRTFAYTNGVVDEPTSASAGPPMSPHGAPGASHLTSRPTRPRTGTLSRPTRSSPPRRIRTAPVSTSPSTRSRPRSTRARGCPSSSTRSTSPATPRSGSPTSKR